MDSSDCSPPSPQRWWRELPESYRSRPIVIVLERRRVGCAAGPWRGSSPRPSFSSAGAWTMTAYLVMTRRLLGAPAGRVVVVAGRSRRRSSNGTSCAEGGGPVFVRTACSLQPAPGRRDGTRIGVVRDAARVALPEDDEDSLWNGRTYPPEERVHASPVIVSYFGGAEPDVTIDRPCHERVTSVSRACSRRRLPPSDPPGGLLGFARSRDRRRSSFASLAFSRRTKDTRGGARGNTDRIDILRPRFSCVLSLTLFLPSVPLVLLRAHSLTLSLSPSHAVFLDSAASIKNWSPIVSLRDARSSRPSRERFFHHARFLLLLHFLLVFLSLSVSFLSSTLSMSPRSQRPPQRRRPNVLR